jgi:dynein heavy chain
MCRSVGFRLNCTPDVVWKTFVNRVRSNLHIVLAMSPVGDSFRVRCRMFPSLINCTTIDWFSKWPHEALLSVSGRFLAEVELPSPAVREALSEMCVDIHMSMDTMCDKFFQTMRRRVYTTPKSYLDLIKLYVQVLKKRRDVLGENKRRLDLGLVKLKEANEQVALLQEKVKEFQPKVLQKAADAEEMLKKVAIDQKDADVTKAEVEEEERIVSAEAAIVREQAEDAEKDLAAALPALKVRCRPALGVFDLHSCSPIFCVVLCSCFVFSSNLC